MKRLLLFTILAVIPVFFWNCSGKFAPATNSSLGSNGPVLPANANGDIVVSSGTTGAVQAFQDLNFSLKLSTSDPGPFTASGLPAWAKLNAATGQITGVPVRVEDGGTVTIQGVKSAFGPYSVQIVGNPLKEYQWHLNNTGQTAFSLTAGKAGEDMHMSNTVLSGITGSGIKIGVSDSGAYIAHEALAPNVIAGECRNYLNNYAVTNSWLGDPTPTDLQTPDNAHGTAVSSLIAEKGWNGIGGRGVAPDAKFAAFEFIEAFNQLSTNGMLDAALGDQFTGDFDAFNYSWGDPQCYLVEYPQTFWDHIAAVVPQQRSGKGSVMSVAAGNYYVEDIKDCYNTATDAAVFGSAEFSELLTSPYMMAIAAVNANGVSSSYSSPGANLWVTAPGGEFGLDQPVTNDPVASEPAIVAADFPGCAVGLKTVEAANSAFDKGGAPNTGCKYVSTMNGTSSATPLVTGVVALLLQVNPNLTWRDVKYILAKTADKIDPNVNPAHHPDPNLDLAGHVYDMPWITNKAGFNFMSYYGFGRVNVDNAVAMAKGYVSALGPLTITNWAQDSGTLALSIPDDNAAGVTSTLNVTNNLTIEAVQIRTSVDACVGDMGIELVAPSGTKSILMPINSRLQDTSIMNHTFESNAFYGENSKGTWTLTVIDGYPGCTGHLTNWKLNFFGY